jgi:hypothetical protein
MKEGRGRRGVSSRLSGNESCSRKQAAVGARGGLSQPSELLTDRSEPAAGGAERVRDGAGAKQHDELAPRRRRRIAEIVKERGGIGSGSADMHYVRRR